MQNSAPEIDERADCNDGDDRLPVGSVVRDGEEEVVEVEHGGLIGESGAPY